MKKLSTGLMLLLVLAFSTLLMGFQKKKKHELEGAWKLVQKTENGKEVPIEDATKIISDDFFTVAYYNTSSKSFSGTYGGTFSGAKGELKESYEFNTWTPDEVGTSSTFQYSLNKKTLKITGSKSGKKTEEVWERIPETVGPLTGAWRISGRADNDGNINIIQRGVRKTMKINSGSRFQWIAFNTETKEFFGTGGGIYTAKDGQYIETLEFFSRDNNRVGMSLNFNFKVDGKDWHHSGLSSTGNKISEIWSRD
jgi:hypothetical protein